MNRSTILPWILLALGATVLGLAGMLTETAIVVLVLIALALLGRSPVAQVAGARAKRMGGSPSTRRMQICWQ